MADREHNCSHGNVPSILQGTLNIKANVSQVCEKICSNNVRNAQKTMILDAYQVTLHGYTIKN